MTATTAICSPSGAQDDISSSARDWAPKGRNTHATGSPDGFGPEFGEEDILDFVRDGTNDIDEPGDHL